MSYQIEATQTTAELIEFALQPGRTSGVVIISIAGNDKNKVVSDFIDAAYKQTDGQMTWTDQCGIPSQLSDRLTIVDIKHKVAATSPSTWSNIVDRLRAAGANRVIGVVIDVKDCNDVGAANKLRNSGPDPDLFDVFATFTVT